MFRLEKICTGEFCCCLIFMISQRDFDVFLVCARNGFLTSVVKYIVNGFFDTEKQIESELRSQPNKGDIFLILILN